MIKGIGIDIVEIERIRELAESSGKFAERILTGREHARYLELKDRRRFEFLAGRFAAKEAFSKAYGTGIGKELSFHSISVGNDRNGKPFIEEPFSSGVHLSISHSRDYAVAQVVIEELDAKDN